MSENIATILLTEQVTHDVRRFRIQKPEGYSFIPGQATDVSINTPELRSKKRPFTFTCLNSDPYLEFTIKIYPSHQGVTNELGKLSPGDQLIIRDPWGSISYKGKGVFVAGGAGITPFIAIFRDLVTRNELEGNILLFANRTKNDIIMGEEFHRMFGQNFVNILSDETIDGYSSGLIDKNFITSYVPDLNRRFYVCGPPPMMKGVLFILNDLGVPSDSIITETF